jgi:hypothetical protein
MIAPFIAETAIVKDEILVLLVALLESDSFTMFRAWV